MYVYPRLSLCSNLGLKLANAFGVNSQRAQPLDYLRATDIEVGLLLNFGERPEFKRLVFDNLKKGPTIRKKPCYPRLRCLSQRARARSILLFILRFISITYLFL